MKYRFIILTLLLVLMLNLYAQQKPQFDSTLRNSKSIYYSTKSNWLTKEASYVGDFASNLHGGKRTGSLYLGMANIKLGFKTKSIGLWNGGEFFIHGVATHGGTPSEKLFGDFQVASNIEAGNHTYIHELWYKHSFENLQFTFGLQDLNTEFVTSENACSFINSSFGVPSLISSNVPIPIFPLTALGISCRYKMNENFLFQVALFDGFPESFDNNQHNLNWKLKDDDGTLIFTELQFSSTIKDLHGTFKTGYYYHSHLRETSAETGIPETVFENNYGLYVLADQTIYQADANNSLGVFTQAAVSPGNININDYYFGCGLNCTGVFNNEDAAGFAFAYAHFNNESLKDETTLEMFYKSRITENLFVQPDIQYIINPAGTETNLTNSLAALIRFGINF